VERHEKRDQRRCPSEIHGRRDSNMQARNIASSAREEGAN
jgi:hypothetical protein